MTPEVQKVYNKIRKLQAKLKSLQHTCVHDWKLVSVSDNPYNPIRYLVCNLCGKEFAEYC